MRGSTRSVAGVLGRRRAADSALMFPVLARTPVTLWSAWKRSSRLIIDGGGCDHSERQVGKKEGLAEKSKTRTFRRASAGVVSVEIILQGVPTSADSHHDVISENLQRVVCDGQTHKLWAWYEPMNAHKCDYSREQK